MNRGDCTYFPDKYLCDIIIVQLQLEEVLQSDGCNCFDHRLPTPRSSFGKTVFLVARHSPAACHSSVKREDLIEIDKVVLCRRPSKPHYTVKVKKAKDKDAIGGSFLA